MNVLIDTQSFIWFTEDDIKIPEKIKNFMNSKDNVLLLSIASLWEITIKTSMGKLKMQKSIDSVIKDISETGFKILPIKAEHLLNLSKLEFIHRDPFDRMIISQGIAENIPVISSDGVFKEYPIQVIWL
jgi:PIN domain nuclease of toxin-antitoxin system